MARRARLTSRLALAALTGCAGVALLLASGCTGGGTEPETDVPVLVDRIAIDTHNVPVVVLEEQGGPRWLPIWIGTSEARSIALQMEERPSPRPNTHDLARDVIQRLDARVERVVVTELRDGTYYAILGIRLGDRSVEVDSRPSDAIAIALRADAPIFVRATVFEAAGTPPDDEEHPRREI